MNRAQTKLKKIGNRYFLPFDWIEKLDIFVLLFSFIALGILAYMGSVFLLGILLFWMVSLFLYVKDRFLTGIETNRSFDENVNLIRELAQKQDNVSESVEVKGLFLFEYPIRNISYFSNLRKRNNSEVIVIYCEENTIWVGAYCSVSRKLDFARRNNLKQWMKLIQIRTAVY